jgi:hypothetical protein
VKVTMMDMETGRTTHVLSAPVNIPFYEPAAGSNGRACAIPQSLIFNGAPGGGQSGGSFSGKVIWLNVTS